MKLRYFISIVSIVGLMYGCIDDELFYQTKEAASKEVTVSLNLGGEILVADEPMTRGVDDPDIYGIQVYKDGEPFAHGVFDNVDNVKINLLAGSKYKFVASMVKDGKSKILHDFTYFEKYSIKYTNSDYYNIGNNPFLKQRYRVYNNYYFAYYRETKDSYKHYYPKYNKEYIATLNYIEPIASRKDAFIFPFCFMRDKESSPSVKLVFNHETTNSMMYNGEYDTDITSLNMLDEGYSTMSDGTLTNYPEVDRFYGEVDNYTPQENGSLTIDMKRAAFGLKCQVTGITDGSVSVKIENDSRVFFENEAITDDTISDEKVFTFANVRDAWLYADNYEEKLQVTVDWLRGIGITENLGTATISVKRNTMNKVRINLGAVDNSSSLSINVEDDAYINNNSIEVPFAQ